METLEYDEQEDIEDDDHIGTYAKSFRHFTREALPRMDNYRNTMSINAAGRPTLEELLNEKFLGRIPTNVWVKEAESVGNGMVKFGWVTGVLVRNLLNIWGVMLFLRLTWVVGQSGIIESILVIVGCSIVTFLTSLSMCAISTNGLIKGGGTYFMISRSLGPEFGASIGLIFSLANAIACAMYIVGFCECLLDLLQRFDSKIIDGEIHDTRIIGSITLLVLLGIVIVGMEWEAKAQVVLLIFLLIAILDFIFGALLGPRSDSDIAKGFVGFNYNTLKDNLYSNYTVFEGKQQDFFSVFSVFFPAASGFLAGANISGDLKDPQVAIPKGTLLSVILTTFTYVAMAIMSGWTVVRTASGDVTELANGTFTNCSLRVCHYGLQNSNQVISLVAVFGPIIYVGCFAATLSSALASLVSAPKVFQALCKDMLYPCIGLFGKGYGKNQEPVRGYVLTFFIALSFILVGKLNLIAPLISNFFLAAYALINFSTFHVSLMQPVGWRPTFKYYNMWLSLLGACLCVVVMFLISRWTAFITFAIVFTLYLFVSYRKPDVNWGSSTQAQTYKNALFATQLLNRVEDHVKNFRPQILVLSGLPHSRPLLVKFANLITKNLSLLICGNIDPYPLTPKFRYLLIQRAQSWLHSQKIKGFYAHLDPFEFELGAHALMQGSGLGKLKPNIVMIGFKSDWKNCERSKLVTYFNVLQRALDNNMALVVLRLQEGLDYSCVLNDYDQDKNGEMSKIPLNDDVTKRSSSFSHISHESNSSNPSNPSTPATSDTRRTKTENENQDKDNNLYNFEVNCGNGMSSEKIQRLTQFQRKQTNGIVDVWWLYDDGGLTMLLPYLIRNRRNWSDIKLRVFTLANKNNDLCCEQRSMASLLAKFRIDYSDLKVIPDITKKPQQETVSFFEELIKDIMTTDEREDPLGERITESELLATKDKTNRHIRLRELLFEYSKSSNLIVMTLPMPRKKIVSPYLYMAWLETLTKDMPPFLLVRGNQQSVLTYYS